MEVEDKNKKLQYKKEVTELFEEGIISLMEYNVVMWLLRNLRWNSQFNSLIVFSWQEGRRIIKPREEAIALYKDIKPFCHFYANGECFLPM